MTLTIGFILCLVVGMMIGLAFELVDPIILISTILAIFIITNIISIQEALSGFINNGVLTMALLFLISIPIQQSGLIERILAAYIGRNKKQQTVLVKLLIPVTFISGFINNTPIVVSLTPVIRNWCERHHLSPSKFLMPISFASILGGMLTLIGTSTNMIIDGMLKSEGHSGLSFFEVSFVGLPAAILGILYLSTIGYKLLPNEQVLKKKFANDYREYVTEITVTSAYKYIGHTVYEAHLRQLKKVFLTTIIRGEHIISPVSKNTLIKEGDRLIFAGDISDISDLTTIEGFSMTSIDKTPSLLDTTHHTLVEAVISHRSSLINSRINETNFRSKFNAAVVAVHRHNKRLKHKIGNIVLRPGDSLLLVVGRNFENKTTASEDFYCVTQIKGEQSKQDKRKGWLTLSSFSIAIFFVILGMLSITKAMLIEVLFLLATHSISLKNIKNHFPIRIILTVALMIGLGTALTSTGTANWIAHLFVQNLQPFGVLPILIFLYLFTNIMTQFITNNAAAVMILPIALDLASELHVAPIVFILIVVIASSASFLTPLGYQTNMIIYGPGGYRFHDFIKVGFPLTLLVMISTISMVSIIWL